MKSNELQTEHVCSTPPTIGQMYWWDRNGQSTLVQVLSQHGCTYRVINLRTGSISTVRATKRLRSTETIPRRRIRGRSAY